MVEEISFKEFMKRDPDYIRIYKNELNQWILYGSSDVEVKVFGKQERQTVLYEVLKDEVNIYVSYLKGWDDKTEYVNPKQFNFHSSDCETLKTLLSHNITELNLEYWANNQSENAKAQNQRCETIRITANKYKTGKLLKTHRIGFNTPSYFGSIASKY